MRDPARADVKDLGIRFNVGLVEIGQCFYSAIVNMIHETWLSIEVVVITRILSTEVSWLEWPFLWPLWCLKYIFNFDLTSC